jgi:hypothetical protein
MSSLSHTVDIFAKTLSLPVPKYKFSRFHLPTRDANQNRVFRFAL